MIVLEGIFALLQVLSLILFAYYGWVVIVLVMGYLIWQNQRKVHWVGEVENTLLQIEVPKDNEKKELSAEQMLASLHGILRPKSELAKEGSLQEHISFEIASVGNLIRFYTWVPKHLKTFVEGQLYAQYPSVEITEVTEDYCKKDLGERFFYGTELSLIKNEVLPIKTFPSFEVDPIAGITASLSSLDRLGEEMWMQVLARPVDDSWHEKGDAYIKAVKTGKSDNFLDSLIKGLLELPLYILGNLIPGVTGTAPAKKDEKKDDKKAEEKLSASQSAAIKAVEEKTSRLGYEVKIRIAYLGPDKTLARQRMQALVGAFKQFNTTNLNGFTPGKYTEDEDFLQEYQARLFVKHGYILNIEELASVYHLPHKNVETPNMVWTTSKKGEPPANLPTEKNIEPENISLFAQTNFRGGKTKFGIKRDDRGRHLYIIGQTGAGKSSLLQLLTLSDIYHNHGMAIIDPHGDFASEMLQYIPPHRVKDIIYFNPADINFPVAFNPLEIADPNNKNHISSELVGVLKRMFESWGPRLEYILRFTILALLDYPDSTMLGITRMLTEKDFRKKVIKQVKDPVVKNFWVNEFASWNDKFASEAVAPVLNKVGAFTANPLIRNVIGQPKSTFDLRKIMDEGKILVVNLSRGQVGEDNAAILGALMVTKIQLAAMSRANIPMADRRPFYLYVDEFQNFATDSFAVILSEARKYKLNLTVANQYISQMPETVREAVFGNVGSMITFRVGASDSAFLSKYYEPVFEAQDIVKLHNRDILITMSIDGEKAAPFSARTLGMPEPSNDLTTQIIEHSRQTYSSSREEVEDMISRWTSSALEDLSSDGEAMAGNEPNENSASEQKPNLLTSLKNPVVMEHSSFAQNKQGGGRPHHGSNNTRPAHRSHASGDSNSKPSVQNTQNNQQHDIKPDEVVRLR